jgi:hypothetical protein
MDIAEPDRGDGGQAEVVGRDEVHSIVTQVPSVINKRCRVEVYEPKVNRRKEVHYDKISDCGQTQDNDNAILRLGGPRINARKNPKKTSASAPRAKNAAMPTLKDGSKS